MSKSKSRNETKCENCFLCQKINEFHKYNDISTLLTHVDMWDIENNNQFKNIEKFECLVCYFKTSSFNEWKCHIMSISHLSDSHSIKDVYSYVCCNKKCKILFYGSKNCLTEHTKTHSEHFLTTGIWIFMAEVMKRYFNKENPFYFCSHCKKFADQPIHNKNELSKINLNNYIKFYCKYCKVELHSSPEMLDCHSLSVEHMTLKCYDYLCSTAKVNSKKFKSSESESNHSENNNTLPILKNTLTTNSIKLPMIVLNRFEIISPYLGECDLCKLCKCKVCDVSVSWDSHKLLSHLYNCEYSTKLSFSNDKFIKTFLCSLCEYSTNSIYEHKLHVISLLHLTNFYNTQNCYSYFCNVCNVFMYSQKQEIRSHCTLCHKIFDNSHLMLPIISTFMANVFNDLCTNPNRVNFIHYYGNDKPNNTSKVLIQCHTCKIEFHTSINDYNIHKISNEHIILKFFSNKIPEINVDDLETKSKMVLTNKSVEIQPFNNVLSAKIYQCKEAVNNNEHLQNMQLNKTLTNLDVNCSRFLIIEKDQNEFVNHGCVKESNHHTEYNNKKTTRSKPQYIKYFKHKMNILNVLRQYKDRIIKTLSYYCHYCDFMVEEKYIWDKHNLIEHLNDTNLSEFHCSTCSMLIVGANKEEHNDTIEHSILFSFLNSMELVEKDLLKKTTFVNSGESSSSVDTNFMDLEKNVKSGQNNEEKNQDDSGENLLTTTIFTSLDNVDKNTLQNVGITSFDALNLVKNEVSSKESNHEFVSLFSEDIVKEELKPEVLSILNEEIVASCPLLTNRDNFDINEESNKSDEDKSFGEYVSQRIKLIENKITKQDIKLEIDHIFYLKIKQLTQNT